MAVIAGTASEKANMTAEVYSVKILSLLLFCVLIMIVIIGISNDTYAKMRLAPDTNSPRVTFISSQSTNITTFGKPANLNLAQDYLNNRSSSEYSPAPPFNPNIPITLPLLEGYYNGTKVYFVFTEASDNRIAQAITRLTNFPVNFIQNLTSLTDVNTSKLYAFTNGLPSLDDFGGGPFEFQINVFDSVPSENGYKNLMELYTVTWKDPTTARILDSVESINEAQANGELIINKSGNVVNSPILSWLDQSEDLHNVYFIDKVIRSMPNFKGKIIYADIYNFVARIKLIS